MTGINQESWANQGADLTARKLPHSIEWDQKFSKYKNPKEKMAT